MPGTAINTLRYARRLKAAGVPDHQAEETAGALGDEPVGQLATKDDLEKSVTRLEGTLTLMEWMVGLILAFVVAIAWRVFASWRPVSSRSSTTAPASTSRETSGPDSSPRCVRIRAPWCRPLRSRSWAPGRRKFRITASKRRAERWRAAASRRLRPRRPHRNKPELSSRVAADTSLSRAAADCVVDAVLSTHSDALATGEPVAIARSATFCTRARAARRGRNARTGEPFTIAASKVTAFKAGKTLRDTVRG